MPKIKNWIKRNWKELLSITSLYAILTFVTQASEVFGLLAIKKEEMLKSLIGAEATILGFFGLIIVYALTSIDNRIDRCEQQIFDTKEKYLDFPDHPESIKKIGEARVTDLNTHLSKMEAKKTDIIWFALTIGFILVVSFLLSILTLGMGETAEAFQHCKNAINGFFMGIILIFVLLYYLSQK